MIYQCKFNENLMEYQEKEAEKLRLRSQNELVPDRIFSKVVQTGRPQNSVASFEISRCCNVSHSRCGSVDSVDEVFNFAVKLIRACLRNELHA